MGNEKYFFAVGALGLMYYVFGTGPAAPTSLVSLAEASNAANPTVFFDISIGDVPAGRVTYVQ